MWLQNTFQKASPYNSYLLELKRFLWTIWWGSWEGRRKKMHMLNNSHIMRIISQYPPLQKFYYRSASISGMIGIQIKKKKKRKSADMQKCYVCLFHRLMVMSFTSLQPALGSHIMIFCLWVAACQWKDIILSLASDCYCYEQYSKHFLNYEWSTLAHNQCSFTIICKVQLLGSINFFYLPHCSSAFLLQYFHLLIAPQWTVGRLIFYKLDFL